MAASRRGEHATERGVRLDRGAPLWWVALAGSLVSAVAVLVASRRGLGVIHDSTLYLSSGTSLADGNGLRSYLGDLTLFPPGLPAVIAVGSWLGVSPDAWLRGFNALCAAATVWLTAWLLRRHLHSVVVASVATAFVALSWAMLVADEWVMSEPPFLVVTLAFLLVLETAVRAPSRAAIVGLCAIVWAAFLLRYSGLAFIPVGMMAFVLVGRRWRAMAAFAIGSLVVPVLWMLRNRAVDGNLMGPRGVSEFGVVDTVRHSLATVGQWLLPFTFQSTGHEVLGVIALTTVVGLFVWLLRRGEGRALLALASFVVIYAGWMATAQLTTDIVALDSRLLIPVLLPLVVIVAVEVETVISVAPASWARPIRYVGIATAVVLLVVQGGLMARAVRYSTQNGIGFALAEWTETPVNVAVRSLPADASLYSNDPYQLWAMRRHGPIGLPESWRCGPGILVWYDPPSEENLTALDPATDFGRLEVVEETDTGTIYQGDGPCPSP